MGELHVEFTVCDPNRLQPTCKAAAAVEFKPREVEGTSVQEGVSVRILQTAKESYQVQSLHANWNSRNWRRKEEYKNWGNTCKLDCRLQSFRNNILQASLQACLSFCASFCSKLLLWLILIGDLEVWEPISWGLFCSWNAVVREFVEFWGSGGKGTFESRKWISSRIMCCVCWCLLLQWAVWWLH